MISLNDVLLAASNIPVDDPIAEIWGRGLQGGYKIIKYTGSLPITINADGNVLIDYRIYGADGGVGEPTENLFECLNDMRNADKWIFNPQFDPYHYFISYELSAEQQTLLKETGVINGKVFLKSGGSYYTGEVLALIPELFERVDNQYRLLQNNGTVLNFRKDVSQWDSVYLCIGYGYGINANNKQALINSLFDNFDIMLSSTAPANYIPYGYKLPMTVYDGETTQTVPIYIGENQLDSVEGVSDYVDKSSGKIVRMIGEYTFTGDESFNKYGGSDVFYTSKTIDPVGITTVNTITMRCNHPAFTVIENKDTRYWLNPEADDVCCFLPGGMSQVFLRSTSNFTTATECKAYLKAQYDNGTPVKISYWLKTPVEEDPPVSFPDIPTINGETIIDYDGTPKPSQMYVKYKDKG